MGIFDIFRSKAAKPKDASASEPPPGWGAIDAAFHALYPGQTNPIHRAPLRYRMHDLSETAAAFDGISAYDAGEFWHLVSYGLTELYGKESRDATRSGFGYELTLRIPKNAERPPVVAFDLLEGIGKAVWKGSIFAIGHTIKTGPVDGRPDTRETAILVLGDPAFPAPIQTPHGSFEFLMLLGVTDEYRHRMLAAHDAQNGTPGWERDIVAELRASNPNLLTPIHDPQLR